MPPRPSLLPQGLAIVVVTLGLASGCRTPEPSHGSAAMPNLGPAIQDVRTEVNVQQIELEYIAAKNSTRTNQHRAETEKKKKEAEQAEAAKQAKAKQDAAAPAPEPPPAEPKP